MKSHSLRLSTLSAAVLLVLASGCGVQAPAPDGSPGATLPAVTATTPAQPEVDTAGNAPRDALASEAKRKLPKAREEIAASRDDRGQVAASVHRSAETRMLVGAVAPAPAPQLVDLAGIRAPSAEVNRDRFAPIHDNPVHAVAEDPVSTFSIDVDTGAYAVVRRHLNEGRLPPEDAVRVEELINYFDYAYAAPADTGTPFAVTTEVAPAPWNDAAMLVRVGVKGFEVAAADRPAANLVFLVDVSGSMQSADKLPLLKSALGLMLQGLTARDRVSLVVYAGASGVVLEPTPGDQAARIRAALDQLSAGGSTHGLLGIELAYAMAEQGRVAGGINRVILATDGDFNVGTVNHEQLVDLVERKRHTGISLTTLGFGGGNYNDALMEQLADHGNGHYAYIDTVNEANKVLVEELSSTLQTIASDVKIQVEWNPVEVAEYRLIGYENRVLAREDFTNDKVDAGEIGAGHRVTALYEIVPTGSAGRRLPELRYGSGAPDPNAAHRGELGWLKLRFKKPGEGGSTLVEQPIAKPAANATLAGATDDLRFAASVAAFGQKLRGGRYTGTYGYSDIAALAAGSRGADRFGYRGEFLRLVHLAESLDSRS